MFLAARSVIAARGPLCGPAIAILGYGSGGAIEESCRNSWPSPEMALPLIRKMRVLLNSIDMTRGFERMSPATSQLRYSEPDRD